ncbi:MAG: zf-TFIIB domain-containing protein [Saprospiraceae bacterium]|jgi:Zn-finger nucleic acid-binding protein|nr:zf-TFIIB domain-containing protein [Lewinellaceae bacterium]
MLCPVCKKSLTNTTRSGVEIDYCPNCRGVWLDRGELEKIIARSIAQPSDATAENLKMSGGQKMERFQVYPPVDALRQKHFLEEVFDW